MSHLTVKSKTVDKLNLELKNLVKKSNDSMNNCNNEIFNQLFSRIDNDTGLYLNNLLLHVDGSEVNGYCSASAEYFKNDDVWHYPLVSGKYFTADDVKNGNKVVLIGSSLDEYSYKKNNEKYLKIEEIQEGEEIFGVITDVTEEIRKRREIEYQRDHDQLTGLFNRTGRDARLSKILEECREPYYCAAVMVDADGLKMVNDTYGHENGDEYLKKIAEMLKQEAGENCILCRQGGDEFTLFYYKYEKEALIQKIEALKALQSGQKAWLRDGLTVDLRFSMGSSMAYGAVDYDKMYREADEKMYEDKRMRKKLAEETNTIES